MNSRAAILARLQRKSVKDSSEAAVCPPEIQHEDYAALIDRFTQLAAATQMSTACVRAGSEVPAAVRAYLGEQQQRRVVIDPMLDIAGEDWSNAGLHWSHADTNPDGDVYIREGLAAIAECGAVVIASGAGRKLRNDFLAHTHIVVVPLERLLPAFSGLWGIMRAQQTDASIAREVCLITGPSRTADLGVPAKLGAHGPARVHVVLVGG